MITPEPIEVSQLTEGTLDGSGVFDVLLQTTIKHLDEEFRKSRITGAERAQVYLGSITAVMAQATQFLLQKDQSFYQGQLLANQADLILLEKDKVALELVSITKQNEKLTKEIALMDKQGLLLDQQLITERASTVDTTTGTIGKTQTKLIAEQVNLTKQGNILAQTELKAIQDVLLAKEGVTNAQTQREVLTGQVAKIGAEESLLEQKKVTEASQTGYIYKEETNEFIAFAPSTDSVVGKQKILYSRQADGLLRDSEQKASKLFLDAYAIRATNPDYGDKQVGGGSDANTMMNIMKAGVVNAT